MFVAVRQRRDFSEPLASATGGGDSHRQTGPRRFTQATQASTANTPLR
jgi:hypothetical protein